MKKVLLSHDGKMKMYLVPDEVADNLKDYCMSFACDWIMNDPNAQKLRVITPSGIIGYIFGAQDFIDYLNDFIFPSQKSILVDEMDFYVLILSILVYTFFSRMFDLMLPSVVKHSTVVV